MHMVRASKESESGAPPDPRMMEAIGRLAGELMQSGRMIEMGGLLPSATGARVRASGGKISVTDGPFAEVKELIGGYAIIEASSREQAIEDARRFLQVHIDVMGAEYEGECEVRQLFQ